MSAPTRPGLRAARGLLALLEENSPEDFEAAQAILGGDKRLQKILRLLSQFSEDKEEPLNVETLRDLVREQILALKLPNSLLAELTGTLFGEEPAQAKKKTKNEILDSVFHIIQESSHVSNFEAGRICKFLELCFEGADPKNHNKRFIAFMQPLVLRALAANTVMFPTLHSLAELAVEWKKSPLPYSPGEPRRGLILRLLSSVIIHAEGDDHLVALLERGLQGPADAEIAALKRDPPRRANGK